MIQAFVLGAGLGTRLRPLTDELPKPLVPIFGKPLITFAFDHLIAAGCTKLIVNTHHLPGAFGKEPHYRDVPVTYEFEPVLLETGGGIKNVERHLRPEPFIVYSGDVLTDIDLEALVAEHFRAGNDVTLALRDTGIASGVAFRDGRVVDIAGRFGQTGNHDFANVSIWNPTVFPRIPAATKVSFIPVLLDWIQQGGQIGGLVLNKRRWFNLGSRTAYLEVHRTILEEKWKPKYVTPAEWPTRVSKDVIVPASVTLGGFYSIGAGAQIGEDVTIENTIVWPGSQIASRSRLRNCIVRSHRTAQGDLRDLDI